MSNILIAHPLCPFSRMIRIILKELQIPFDQKIEKFWEKNDIINNYNPAQELPIFISHDHVICDTNAIIGYIFDTTGNDFLSGKTAFDNAEIRRLTNWFGSKIYHDAIKHILFEKVIRFYLKEGEPVSSIIRIAKDNLEKHLMYLSFLLEDAQWLVANKISYCDIAAAAQLSCLDYLGEINWDNFPFVKNWYAVIKSRPSFRDILNDRINGFTPDKNYTNLDF
jgi:glutathione S-transferase